MHRHRGRDTEVETEAEAETERDRESLWPFPVLLTHHFLPLRRSAPGLGQKLVCKDAMDSPWLRQVRRHGP